MGKGIAGIVRLRSNYSVDQTIQKLEALLEVTGVRLFAVIDHGGEANRAGLEMQSTKLLIFGDPKAGTPIMLATPSAALDLPLKILVAEDEAGLVWISYNTPEYLRERHGFPRELVRNLAAVEVLAAKSADGDA